jgi:hypothetical protein
MEDLKWKQRAKRNWYKQGDSNTKKKNHAWATQRRRTNFISKIKDEHSHSWTKAEDIGTTFTSYF